MSWFILNWMCGNLRKKIYIHTQHSCRGNLMIYDWHCFQSPLKKMCPICDAIKKICFSTKCKVKWFQYVQQLHRSSYLLSPVLTGTSFTSKQRLSILLNNLSSWGLVISYFSLEVSTSALSTQSFKHIMNPCYSNKLEHKKNSKIPLTSYQT